MSKYYGESERLLGKVFSLANEIPSGAIIFLDEAIFNFDNIRTSIAFFYHLVFIYTKYRCFKLFIYL